MAKSRVAAAARGLLRLPIGPTLRLSLPRSVRLLERILRLSSRPIANELLPVSTLLDYQLSGDLGLTNEEIEEIRMVLSNIVTVERSLTATDLDVLAGTQLDQPGVPGVYTIWLASTVGDSSVSITLGGLTLTNAAVIILRANSEIRENEDSNFQMLSKTGGRPVISVTEVTAMVCRVRVKFLPAARV